MDLDILYNKETGGYMKFKEKLEILKYNFQCMKVDYQLKESFIVEKLKIFECYNITQNINSLSLLFHSFRYPNAQTYFFVELFNFYQNLPLNEDYPYHSFSQSITTYCLKEMEKRGLISIVKQLKSSSSPSNLGKCMELFGNFQYRREEVSMYHIYFYKLRSFNNQDTSFLQEKYFLLRFLI